MVTTQRTKELLGHSWGDLRSGQGTQGQGSLRSVATERAKGALATQSPLLMTRVQDEDLY